MTTSSWNNGRRQDKSECESYFLMKRTAETEASDSGTRRSLYVMMMLNRLFG